ncbi:MAG: hypothetical protein AAF517_15355 [Planctomycetota bacterium]
MLKLASLATFLLVLLTATATSTDSLAADADLAGGHPRPSYDDVEDIDAMAAALRKSLAEQRGYSFSRGWWTWDRLRCRYVDGGRKNEKELKILAAVFRALILDWHAKLEAKGEGDLLYIFFTTMRGDKRERVLAIDNRKLLRDLHGGGYHGSWGSACRMRIYEELARQGVLTDKERATFRKIVHQSLEPKFINFREKGQSADNHTFGNGGGVALAIRIFPDAPQAKEARAWLDRIWKHLSDYGDWTEWNYYPYGPIFLHGLIDVAEATGRLETEADLINALGARCLGFLHGGGIRGNPNSGVRMRKSFEKVYQDPWNHGYYDVETSARDGHFWYRLAQHYKNPEYLWAAEQVALGGRPANGKVPAEYEDAYRRRFGWFIDRNISPRTPKAVARIGLLSATKHKVHERIYLRSSRAAGEPVASYFLYDKKDSHLDNVSGQLYEYSARGAKLLHCSGKYNNVYSGTDLRGGGTGEESLDLLLVNHGRHAFPVHPDRKGDQRDFLRRGSIKNLAALNRAENDASGNSFGQFAFDNYYGPSSRWLRRTVLTKEGYLVVLDQFVGGTSLGTEYLAGPVWHLAAPEAKNLKDGSAPLPGQDNWLDAPAFAHAWWQKEKIRVLLYYHQSGTLKFGQLRQRNSQDADPNVTCFASRPIEAGREERFLSVLVPHAASVGGGEVAKTVRTRLSESGDADVRIGDIRVSIENDGSWSVKR